MRCGTRTHARARAVDEMGLHRSQPAALNRKLHNSSHHRQTTTHRVRNESSTVQCVRARLIHRVHVGALAQQQLDHGLLCILDGKHQRRCFVDGQGVDLTPIFDENPRNRLMALLCCVVQRGQITL